MPLGHQPGKHKQIVKIFHGDPPGRLPHCNKVSLNALHHLLGQVERGLPALGEEGAELGEKCSSEIGANLREILLSYEQQAPSVLLFSLSPCMLVKPTPLYFSVITSAEALQSGFNISCKSDGSMDLGQRNAYNLLLCFMNMINTCPQKAPDKVCRCHIPVSGT